MFVITARGTISPQTVSAPAGVTIQLTVGSGDGHAHRVGIRTGPAGRVRMLAVPAGGRATIPLSGLSNGRYAVQVDGAPAGALVVGTQPGP
jgi:hypothetical protein